MGSHRELVVAHEIVQLQTLDVWPDVFFILVYAVVTIATVLVIACLHRGSSQSAVRLCKALLRSSARPEGWLGKTKELELAMLFTCSWLLLENSHASPRAGSCTDLLP
jgi:hypothetical protein